jgi:hypothetical protein
MRAVFRYVGWQEDGVLTEIGRDWVMDRITRADWDARALKLARTAAFLTRLRTLGFGEITLTVGRPAAVPRPQATPSVDTS